MRRTLPLACAWLIAAGIAGFVIAEDIPEASSADERDPAIFERVRVVTVAAANARPVHAALQKGTPDVDLVQDLSVGVVEPGLE